MNFPVPLDEEERLRVLGSYGILDTPVSRAFDRLSALAARIFDVPIAFVSLIDRDRQLFKSCFGANLKDTPRDIAFCSHTILEPGRPLVVQDAWDDARFAHNSLVTGEPGIRFYAGMPLLAQQGSALGSFCIIDRVPRSLTKEQLENLRDLAAIVEDEIRLHERRKAARESEERYQELHRCVSNALDHLRESLMWMVPHELSTPLNGVLGFADLLRASWRQIRPEQVEELIAGLQEAGTLMERGVRNICLLTQLEIAASDPAALRNLGGGQTSDLPSAPEDTARRIAIEAGRPSDLELRVTAGRADIPQIYLTKVLEELLDNAFKFSSPGDKVVPLPTRRLRRQFLFNRTLPPAETRKRRSLSFSSSVLESSPATGCDHRAVKRRGSRQSGD